MAPIMRPQNAPQTQDNDDDDVRIVVATQEHREGLIRLMKESFLPREPVEVALGTSWEEARDTLTYETDDCLRQPYSFVAVHPTEGVVGCRVSRFIKISSDQTEDINDVVVVKGEAPTLRTFQMVTDKLMHGWKKQLAQRGCKTALQFINLCVDERFAGRGLAKRMIDESTRLAERLRTDCVFALATNVISQRVLQKAGFVAWRSLKYKEIINDKTGRPFVVPGGDNEEIKWVVKVLNRNAMSG